MTLIPYKSWAWLLPSLLCFAFLLPTTPASATHIVGGELNYRCLGNDNYEISLTVFRDCANGIPQFDDPASIGVFDVNNDLVQEILIDFVEDDTLNPVLFDSCLVIPPDVCVHRTTYTAEINLPFIPGGYQLAYQRCCRNWTILNIVEPLETGATYYNYISEEALLECNSSALFVAWPPTYICVNTPIVFDHSAIDIDGDSLVYKMCTPFHGASFDIPQPQPPNPPPYDSVTWINPPYNLENMLGGVPLSIDPITGLLTGTPNTVGQFVVGICVEEYRDGELISTTKRDFQYNIGVCGMVTSSFFAPELDCDGLDVSFLNQSENITGGYFWDFGVPGIDSDTSSAINPTYFYPDTGTYTITLIAGVGSPCQDTSYSTVSVQLPSLFVDFDVDIIDGCAYPAQIAFTDTTVDTLSTPSEWFWMFSDGSTSTEQNPPIWSVDESGEYSATLMVVSENGCSGQHTETFEVDVLDVNFEDTEVCQGSSVVLNVGGNPLYSYTWSPPNTLNNPFSITPLATPMQTTTYYVTVTTTDGCVHEDSLTVFVDVLAMDIESPILYCPGDEVQLHDDDSGNYTYQWFPLENIVGANTGTPVATPEGGVVTYYVSITGVNSGCSAIDSVQLIPLLEEDIPDELSICEGGSTFLNPDWNPAYTYDWTPSTGLSDPDSPNPLASPQQTTTYYVEIRYVDVACVLYDSVTVEVNPLPEIDIDNVEYCEGGSAGLNPDGNPDYNYIWSPPTNLNNPTLANPTTTTPFSTTYFVTITDENGCMGFDAVSVTVNDLDINFPEELPICQGDTIFLHLDNNPNLDYQWSPDINLINGDTGSPQVYPDSPTTYYVTVTDLETGCVQQDSILVSPVEIEGVPDGQTICEGASVPLNPGGNPSYQYEWSPANSLDNPNSPNPTASPDETTQYIVEITNGDCSLLDTVLIVVDEAPSLSVDNVTICENGMVELNPDGNPNLNYTWSPAGGLDDPTSFNPTATVTETTEYSVTITDDNGCSGTDMVTVTVSEFEIDFQDAIPICFGDTVQLHDDNTSNLDYEWSPDINLIGGDTGSPLAYPDNPIVYYVTVTDEMTGCSQQDSIFVIPVIAETIPDSQIICQGESIPLNPNGNPAYQYEWSPTSTLANPNSPNPVASPDESTTYYVQITDPLSGCVSEDSTLVIVNEDPTLAVNDLALCNGESGQLNPGGNPNYTYVWSPVGGLNDAAVFNPTVTVSEDTDYSVTITDEHGCVGVDLVSVTVNELVVDIQDAVPICFGDTVQLHDDNTQTLDYQWSPNINLIGGDTGSPLAYPDNPIVYYVTVTDEMTGCSQQDSVFVIPVIAQTVPETQAICIGESTQLNPDGNPAFDYEWSPALTLDNPDIPNPNATPSQSTEYYVQITDPLTGCVSNDTSTVIVNSLPSLSANDAALCLGDSTQLNPNGNPDYQYEWSPGTGLDDPESPNPSVSISEGGDYYVTITDSNGCVGVDTVSVTVNELVIDFQDAVPICLGDTVQLHDDSNPDINYQWLPNINLIGGDTGSPLAYPDGPIVYYVNAQDETTGCTLLDSVFVTPLVYQEMPDSFVICEGEEVAINQNGNPAYEYDWTPAETLDDPSLPSPVASPTESTLYQVALSDALTGCVFLDSAWVIVNPLPALAADSITLCPGLPGILNPNGDPAFNYEWSPAEGLDDPNSPSPTVTPIESATYSVTISNPNTLCETEAEFEVFVPELLVLQTSPDTVVCESSLDISASSNTGVSYEWFDDPDFNNNIGTGETVNVSPGLGSTYYVLSADEYGCTATAEVTVGSSAPIVEVPEVVLVCENDSFSVTAVNLNPDDVLFYEWSPSGAIVSGGGTDSPTFFLENDGELQLVVENQYGCVDTLSVPVDVIDDGLGIIATADPDTIYPGESSQLEVTGEEGYTYVWTNGGVLNNPFIQNPVATPFETTTFDVVVTNEIGCTDTAQVTVVLREFICDEPYIFVPNAFTPDNDGVNDVFYVRGNAIDEVYLAVYDRWGEKVFETRDLDIGWDGTFKGERLPPDVYGYYLQVRCLNEEEYFKKGNVTILR